VDPSVPACHPVLKFGFGRKRPRSLEPVGARSSRVLRDFPTHSPTPKRTGSFMDGCMARGYLCSVGRVTGWFISSSLDDRFLIEGLKSKSKTKA
jgi:hypothetical protein